MIEDQTPPPLRGVHGIACIPPELMRKILDLVQQPYHPVIVQKKLSQKVGFQANGHDPLDFRPFDTLLNVMLLNKAFKNIVEDFKTAAILPNSNDHVKGLTSKYDGTLEVYPSMNYLKIQDSSRLSNFLHYHASRVVEIKTAQFPYNAVSFRSMFPALKSVVFDVSEILTALVKGSSSHNFLLWPGQDRNRCFQEVFYTMQNYTKQWRFNDDITLEMYGWIDVFNTWPKEIPYCYPDQTWSLSGGISLGSDSEYLRCDFLRFDFYTGWLPYKEMFAEMFPKKTVTDDANDTMTDDTANASNDGTDTQVDDVDAYDAEFVFQVMAYRSPECEQLERFGILSDYHDLINSHRRRSRPHCEEDTLVVTKRRYFSEDDIVGFEEED